MINKRRKSFLMWLAGGGSGGIQALTPPSGFDWTPPVTIYPDGDSYSTNFNAADWKVAATTDIWVATTGNDTTGTGSQAAPYATIKKALTEAALKADTAINIFVNAGVYTFNLNFSNTACDKDLNIIAVGGRVLSTNKFPLTSWTLDGTGTYRATRSGVQDVRDARYPVTWPNGDQTPALLPLMADLATCQATPGSWYTNNVSVWVHLQDGRTPDANTNGDVGVLYGNAMMLMTHNRKWYIEGFDFESANTSLAKVQPAGGSSVERLVMNDCTFRFQRGATANSVQAHSLGLAILNNCRSFESEGDAFNYSTVSSGTSPATKAVEINCRAYDCGRPSTNGGIINGSTNHDSGRAVRVNGQWANAYGPVVADIGTSQNWYVGCSMQTSLMDDDSSQDAACQTLNTAKTWLDDCSLGGAHYDLYAGNTSQIRYRNMTVSGLTSGDVGTY